MNASNYTQDDCDCLGESDLVRTVKLMSITLVVGFGIFGNVLVILIAVKYTNQRNINFLIVNMAVSDTLIIILYTFMSVPTLVDKNAWKMIPNFTIARYLCKLVRFLDMACKTVTLATLVIISIDRYRATRVTALRLRPYTKRRKVAVVTCSWTLSMASCTLILFVTELYSPNCIYVCQYSRESTAVRDIGLTTMSIIFGLSLLSVILLSIITTLRLRRPAVVHSNLSDAQRQIRAKRITNAVRMVLCSILLYALCYSPSSFWIVLIFNMSLNGFSYDAFGLGCNGLALLLFSTEFLILTNSCLSPYVYILFLPEFRETTKSLFCKQSPAERTGLELTAVTENQGTNRRNNPSPEQAKEQNS